MIQYGPEVGTYSDKPIFEYIITNGLKLIYNGVLPRAPSGEPLGNLLKEGDYLLGPLIYSPEQNLG